MKKYELKKHTANIKGGLYNLYLGCAVDSDQEPEAIQMFDNLDDALDALDKMETFIKEHSSSDSPYPWGYCEVIEYSVEVGEYDEDGEFLYIEDLYITEMYKTLESMPFDKVFYDKSGRPVDCHSTGRQVYNDGWWNEYVSPEGELYLGR